MKLRYKLEMPILAAPKGKHVLELVLKHVKGAGGSEETGKRGLSQLNDRAHVFNPLGFLTVILLAILYYPVHEFGHWLVAFLDNAEILAVHPFPYWDNGFVTSCTVVNEFSFSSIYSLIVYLMAGFLITFLPSALLFIYLRKRESKWQVFPFIWIMESPWASGKDFFDVGRILYNLRLGFSLQFGGIIMSILLITWFVIFGLRHFKLIIR